MTAGPLSTLLGKLGTAEIQCYWVMGTCSSLVVIFSPRLDCLCLQVWLLPRIPAAGRNLFSRRGLIDARS